MQCRDLPRLGRGEAGARRRDGAAQPTVWSVVEGFGEVDGERNFAFVHCEEIGIRGSEAVLLDQHLMLLFRLDVVPHTRLELHSFQVLGQLITERIVAARERE